MLQQLEEHGPIALPVFDVHALVAVMTGQKRALMQGDIFKPARSQSSSVLPNFAHDVIGPVVEHQREGIILRAAALPARFVSEDADLAQADSPQRQNAEGLLPLGVLKIICGRTSPRVLEEALASLRFFLA